MSGIDKAKNEIIDGNRNSENDQKHIFPNIYLLGCAGASLWHMRSSSTTRDQSGAPALAAWSLSYWTSREVPKCPFPSQQREFWMAYEGKPASRAFWAPKPHLSYLRPPPLMGGVPETILLVAIHISLPVLSLQIFFSE